MTLMENRGEIILYQPDDEIRLEVRLEEDTVWLNRQQLSELFGRDIKTIGKHVNNALKEELATIPVVAKFATTASDEKNGLDHSSTAFWRWSRNIAACAPSIWVW